MEAVKTIATYMGKPVEDMSRDELLEVIAHCGKYIELLRGSNEATMRMFKAFTSRK